MALGRKYKIQKIIQLFKNNGFDCVFKYDVFEVTKDKINMVPITFTSMDYEQAKMELERLVKHLKEVKMDGKSRGSKWRQEIFSLTDIELLDELMRPTDNWENDVQREVLRRLFLR